MVLVALSVPAAQAGGPSGAVGVAARKLLVKNVVPDDESRNKVLVVAKDAAIGIPVPGTVGDPRCSGGTATSVVVVGPSFHQTGLACQNWSILGSDTAPKGYRYRDRELDDGTALSISWKPGRLKILLEGKGPTLLTSDLVPGDPIVAVEVTFFTLGAPSNGYCVRCEPAPGKDGSDGKTFLGNATTCPAPFACFGSPSGAFLE